MVHGHACGALHQRLHDDGGDVRVAFGQQRLQIGSSALGHGGSVLAFSGLAVVGRSYLVRAHQQRVVGVAEDGNVRHGQGAQRFAVVTLAHADEFALAALPHVAPVVEAHLESDFHGGCAIAGVEGMPQHTTRAGRQPFGQLNGGRMGAPSQHHVGQYVQLLLERVDDALVGMTEQVDPPAAVGVEVAVALLVVQPRAMGAGDGQRRHHGRALHLRAGVPHAGQAAGLPVGVTLYHVSPAPGSLRAVPAPARSAPPRPRSGTRRSTSGAGR